MPTYMGNVGHLMQHWTLCKLLTIAADEDKRIPGLNFIDAHAMAPWSTRRRSGNKIFDRVRDEHLAPDSEIAYERAWHGLLQEHDGEDGYPNSAAFVEKVWEGDFSLLLCEIYPPTVEVIERWLERDEAPQRRLAVEAFEGDWRKRFRRGLPHPSTVGLETGSLTLISFDPYKYDSRQWVQAEPDGNLYLEDMEFVVSKLSQLESGVLIQLSTYSNDRGRNFHEGIRQSLAQIMEPEGFELCAAVEIDDSMMSLIYARNVPWADANVPQENDLANLPADFTAWLNGI